MFRLAQPIVSPPLPMLVTGVSGVVGYNALPYFRAKYPGQVLGLRQRDNWRLVGPDILVCDAEDYDGLSALFDRYQFASVLDCAGNCALKSCQLDPAMAWRINVDGVRNLLTVIADRDVRLVHLSVDLVFSGTGIGGHVEDDPTDPVTVYGETMVRGEELILESNPSAAILRISLPMGLSFNGHAGAIDWIQSRFRKLKPATLYYDEIRTPHYTDCLNELCDTVLASDLAGVFHAGGARRLSLFQIAQVINRVGGYDPDLLFGCPRASAGPIPPRAGNVAMDCAKLAAAIGREPMDPWPYDDRWVPTDDDWHRRRTEEPGSRELLARVLYRNPNRSSSRGDAETQRDENF